MRFKLLYLPLIALAVALAAPAEPPEGFKALFDGETLDGWSGDAAPMAEEGDGNWSIDVRERGAGTQYRYVIGTQTNTLWKNDPRARAVTNSVGNSIVVDPDAWDWGSTPWSMPA